MKAVASGDERIKEKMDVDLEVSKLQMLKADYDNQRYTLQDKFMVQYPNAIVANEKRLEGLQQDKVRRDKNHSEKFMMTVDGKCFTEREEAGKRILLMAKAVQFGEKEKEIGQYAGFTLSLRQDRVWDSFETKLVLQGALSYSTELSASPHGNTMKLDNLLKSIDKEIENTAAKLEENKKNMTLAKEEYEKPFPYAEALEEKLKRQKELDAALDLGRSDEVTEEEPEAGDQETDVSESNNDDEQQIQSAVDLLPYSNLEKQNYKFLSGMFPEVICGKQDYMKFKADFHDDMYVERIGDDIYALCLFYILNGDVMREPEYTFRIDRERHAARILDWTMSSLGMCQAVYDYENPQIYNPKLKKDLDEAFNSTLRDIEQIDYQPYAECSACEDENEL